MNYITFGIVLSISVICDSSCLSGTRRVILKDGSEDCVFCKECPTDHVVARVCSDQGDTICCPLNTYLPPTEMKQRCLNCSVCLAGQYMSRQCSLTEDVECTDCPTGTFTDDNNSLSCNNCTEDCEHGVQAYCSRSSDTKCKDVRPGAKPNTVVIIVVIGVVLVLTVLCVSVSIYCRRRRTSKHKENVRELKQEDTANPLISDGRNNEFNLEPPDSITLNSTTTDVGGHTVVKNSDGKPECKTVETKQQSELEFKDLHFKGRVERMSKELYKIPSIGILDDTVAKRQWTVFRVGKRFIMTSIEAYERMKVVRNGELGSKISNAHVLFASSKAGFAVLTPEIFVEDKLGVIIMKLSDKFDLPPPLKYDITPQLAGAEFQIHVPWTNLMIQKIDVKLDRMNKDNIESIRIFFQKHASKL